MTESPILPASFFEQIPKAELHCHLDGSLRQTTLEEMARLDQIQIPKALFGQVHASLEQYLEQFSTICQVMQSAKNIERVAYELVEDAAKENIWHIEYRFCPTLLTQVGLSLNDVVTAAIEGGRKAAQKYNISFGVILCGIRSFLPAKNLEIAECAVAFMDKGVVGFDLAGPEFGYPVKDHAAAFQMVTAHSLKVTIHAGEGYGPDSIDQAINYGRADRIGHGTRLLESPDLMKVVYEREIPLEVCLTSNEQTGVVKNIVEHPLPIYLREGVCATLCTDNRLVSETSLTREYERAHKELGLGYSQIKTLVLNGFRSAFLPEETKTNLVAKAEIQLENVVRRCSKARVN